MLYLGKIFVHYNFEKSSGFLYKVFHQVTEEGWNIREHTSVNLLYHKIENRSSNLTNHQRHRQLENKREIMRAF